MNSWEDRFRVARTLWAAIARGRPERGLVCSTRSGAFQLERWNVVSGSREELTHEATGKFWGALSHDGEWVVWHADDAGNEMGHFVATKWENDEPFDLTPDLAPYSSFICAFWDDGWFAAPIIRETQSSLLVIPWNDNGPQPARVIDLGRGHVQQIALGSRHGAEPRTIAYATTGEAPASILRVVNADNGDQLLEINHSPASAAPVSYLNDGTGRLLASTSRTGQIRPMIVEPSGAVHEYELPDVAGDLTPIDVWSTNGTALVLGAHRSVERLYILELGTGALRSLDGISGTFAPFVHGVGTFFAPSGTVIVTREDSATPPEVVEVDPSSGYVHRVLIEAPEVMPSRHLRSVDIATSDGANVQGWLATPDGRGPFPTVIDIHGGPEFNESDRFSAIAQAWVDNGFAFLTVNYRGSTGFGREYLQANWGRPGELELIDIVSAREHLVREGIALPDRVALFGASYGGFMTLLALGRTTGLFATGVAWVAVADWRLMHEDSSNLREYEEAFFKGSPEERPQAYEQASPLTYVSGLSVPLLIIQGRNDVRCPPRQMEAYVSAARELGKSIDIDWFDAGHATVDMETEIGFLRRSITFVQRVFEPQPARGQVAAEAS